MLLTRQKTMLATVVVCSLIICISTLAYVFAADRVGREYLAPLVSDSFAGLLQIQFTHNEPEQAELQAALEIFCNHYQVMEAALYNPNGQRVSHCYRDTPNLRATQSDTPDEKANQYSLHSNEGDFSLWIISDLSLAEFFVLDTLTTTLFVMSISALLIFMLYLVTRHWQKRPYQILLNSIRATNRSNRDREHVSYGSITSPDPDFRPLTQELNDLLWQHEQRTLNLRNAHQQAEKARQRAIRLSSETRQINEHLAQEIAIRRGVENQLNNTQHLLDDIINAMPSALFTLDENLHILQCNQQAGEWLNTPREQLCGRHLTQVLPELEALLTDMCVNQQSPAVCSRERVQIHSFSQPIIADLIMYPLSGQQQARQVLRIDDESQRQQLEEVMVQSEKMTTVAGLATGIAHEINNPLGAILQNLQNVRRRLMDNLPANQRCAEDNGISLPDLQQYLEQRGIAQFMTNIQQAGERAAEIVANMLQFSRPDQHQKQCLDLNRLINDALVIAQGDSHLRNTRTEFIPASEAVMADVLASEIEQVLINLLQNAEQALHSSLQEMQQQQPDWQPHIRISTRHLHGQACILVEDNGPGISEQLLNHIFEPFYTTKEIGQGTGLGLFVSYFIITSHHQGQIRYQTSQLGGAAFEITFPPPSNVSGLHNQGQ